MRLIVNNITKNVCHRCIYGHPSQLEQDVCVMMPFEEKLINWFNEILEAVDENFIIGKMAWISRTIKSYYLVP